MLVAVNVSESVVLEHQLSAPHPHFGRQGSRHPASVALAPPDRGYVRLVNADVKHLEVQSVA